MEHRQVSLFIGISGDYAAAYRQFMNFSHGLSLKQFCEDKGYDYGKLQLALIRIAQLEDELKAQASRPDRTAREKELNDGIPVSCTTRRCFSRR